MIFLLDGNASSSANVLNEIDDLTHSSHSFRSSAISNLIFFSTRPDFPQTIGSLDTLTFIKTTREKIVNVVPSIFSMIRIKIISFKYKGSKKAEKYPTLIV